MHIGTRLEEIKTAVQTVDGGERPAAAFAAHNRALKTLESFETGSGYFEAALTDFHPAIINALEKNGASCFVFGCVGVGKTHLAIATLYEKLCTMGISYWPGQTTRIRRWTPPDPWDLKFWNVPEFMFQIRKSFSDKTGESESIYIEGARESKFLVLDDLGVNRATPYCVEALYLVLDYRWRKGLPTMITSNIPPEALKENYGERMASRISSLCAPLGFTGKDKRRRK